MNRVVSGIVLTLLLGSFLTFIHFVPITVSSPDTVFFDDFNDGNADDWTQNLATWNVVDEEYHVRVGMVENGISTVNALNWTDCVVETQLRFDDTEVGYRAGIVFRYTDNEHYYSFEIGNEYDEIDLIKYSSVDPNYGESRVYRAPNAGNSSITIDANANYTLRVEINGSRFDAYLDGQNVLSWNEDSYLYGRVGLRGRRADVFFDDFVVTDDATPFNETLQLPFGDEFSSPTLDNRWTTVDSDGGSTFDLAARPGWLRITTISPPGRDLYNGVQNAPHIVQSAIGGNFTVETKIMATTTANDEGAGLIVWKDFHTHLRFERISRTIGQPVQQEIMLAVEGAGSGGGLLVLPSDLNPTFLKLVKSGQSYSGYYSSDGATWHHVGDATFPVGDPLGVGLDIIHMYHDGTFFADFDYFRIHDGLWWNRDWQHRRNVNIKENSGYNLADFPVEVTFEHSGNSQLNGTDIRVIDSCVEIPSCVAEYNSTHATVIFETNLTASVSKTVYIYYGNLNASMPSYSLVPLAISEGNTGNATIDNRVYIGWDYTSWGWSNDVELWNDFRIDFNGNNDPTDDSDLIRDYGTRQGGIGRHRADVQAIGLGNYQGYDRTPIYVNIDFADAKLRVYKNHAWVETTQADYMHMFSPSYDYEEYLGGIEQNIVDGEGINNPEGFGTGYSWKENPRWMAFRDSASGCVFASTGLKIGDDYAYEIGGKEASDWDRNTNYNNRTRYEPVLPYDQPSDCRIYWYGDNSNTYTRVDEIARALNNQPAANVVPDKITVPDDFPTIQEAINAANEGDTVFVRNGQYNQYEIIVNKSLTIRGESLDANVYGRNSPPFSNFIFKVVSDNVTLSGFTLSDNPYGNGAIFGYYASNLLVEKNLFINDAVGAYCSPSSNVFIHNNTFEACMYAIEVDDSVNGNIENNTMEGSTHGIYIHRCGNFTIKDNTVTDFGSCGMYIRSSGNNTINGNNIIRNFYGIYLATTNVALTNSIYHNNFLNNTHQTWYETDNYMNSWDDGYPSGGNYWSDYNGTDMCSGQYQNETGTDNVGDTPYVIDSSNRDNYPLMQPWTPPDIAVSNFTTSKTIIGQGYPLNLNVTVENQSNKVEGFTLDIYLNESLFHSENFTLSSGNSTLTTVWNTTSFAKGNYTLAVAIEPLHDEVDITDNNMTNSVCLTIPGDVNGDFTVDVLDSIVVGNSFLATASSSKWNPNADINNDNTINILDSIIVGNHFLEHYP